MTTGHTKQIRVLVLVAAVFAAFALAQSAKALEFSGSDGFLGYVVVSGSPDVTKPGDSVVVTVTGKLAAASGTPDTVHVQLTLDTTSEVNMVITEGDLVFPGDASDATAQYSVAIPQDAINNTYLSATIRDNVRTYSKIALSLIQNPTYVEQRATIQALQEQNSNLQSANSSQANLFYIALFIAAIFIASTVYSLQLALKSNKRKKEAEPAQA